MTEGRPLGHASGGDPGFWDRLGYDEGGLPKHLPMGVTARGEGPENDAEAHHYICWCGDLECPLTLALGHAWKAGRRNERRPLDRPSTAFERPPGNVYEIPPGEDL